MPKITPDTLPTTRPDGPGFYRQDFDGQPVMWCSWWKPGWPHPAQPDGSYRSPQDQQQLLALQEKDGEDIIVRGWEFHAAHGVRVLGAREVQNAGYRLTLANGFLQKQTAEGDAFARDDRALTRLDAALQEYGRLLRDRLSALPCHVTHIDPDYAEQSARETPDFSGPPYTLGESGLPGEADGVLASMLEHIGPKGRQYAARIRERSAELEAKWQAGEISLAEVWLPWLPNPSEGGRVRRHEALAAALWHDVVRRGLVKVPALARAVQAPVLALLSSPPLRYDASTGQRDLGDKRVVARVVHIDTMAAPYLARGIELFQRIITHKVLRHFVFEAHHQAVAGVRFPQMLHFAGGYAALAAALGIEGREGATDLRAIVEAMACLDIPLGPKHSGQLFSRELSEGRRGHRAYLTITVGSPLLPGYVHELKRRGTHGEEDRRAQDLIPLPPIPPTIGRGNEKGAQATLSLHIVTHLRDHARDLVTHGGAPLSLPRFRELAELSRLPPTMAPRVFEHWLQDHGTEGPAFLKRTGTDRYTLGDAHLAERLFLEEGGQRSLDGQAGGIESGRKRAQARRKAGGRLDSGPAHSCLL